MRHLLVVLAILASATVDAQPAYRAALPRAPSQGPGGSATPPSGPLPPPTVAPPVVLPFPPLMTPPAGGLTQGFPFVPVDLSRSRPDLFRAGRHHRFSNQLYFPFVGGYSGFTEPVPPPSPPAPRATGTLRLSGTPAGAQVWVDWYYVGTIEDLEAQRGLTLASGPHRIEIRAPDYEPVTVDVRIMPYETITYRGTLERTRPAVVFRPAAVSPGPMYLIPKCYLGNLPPRPERLPSGCNIKQVQVLGGK